MGAAAVAVLLPRRATGSVPNSVFKLKPSFNMLKPGFNIPQVKGNGGVCLSCPLRYRGNIECEGVL